MFAESDGDVSEVGEISTARPTTSSLSLAIVAGGSEGAGQRRVRSEKRSSSRGWEVAVEEEEGDGDDGWGRGRWLG